MEAMNRFRLAWHTVRAVLRTSKVAPDDEGWRALATGDLDGAEAHALAMLANVRHDSLGDDQDNERHIAHTMLGHVHLKRGDVDRAAMELLQSAEVSDTPVLGSFGPDLSLAWELLRAGRGDEVVTFARKFSRFWPGPSRHLASRSD